MTDGANNANLKRVRFGPFRFHPASGELERHGVRVSLQNTPARLLARLLAQPGELCTRENLCAELWPADLHLDFENNLNNAVARLRQALGDAFARNVERIPRRGYRFIGQVVEDSDAPQPADGCDQALRKARHFRNRTTLRDLWRATAYYRKAIQAQPDCAAAYAGLGDVFILLGDDVIGGVPPTEALTQAETLAQRALDLDSHCATAHTTLAMVDWRLHWNWRNAEDRFRQSLALDPTNATTFQFYSWLLQASGRSRQAWEAMMRALALDPVSSFVSANVGWMLYLDRRYSDALRQLQETLELDENYALARLPLGYALQQTGRMEEAIGHFRFGLAQAGDSYYQAALAQALARSGRQREATAMLASIQVDSISSYNRAIVHAALRDEDQALGDLECAVNEHSSAVPYVNVDPMFDDFCRQRRYRDIANRVGLA